jgi:hypothetical protein
MADERGGNATRIRDADARRLSATRRGRRAHRELARCGQCVAIAPTPNVATTPAGDTLMPIPRPVMALSALVRGVAAGCDEARRG